MTERPELERLRASIAELKANALEQEERLEQSIARLHPTHEAAGRNLAHYLALRQHDLRDLQRGLAGVGLSSLGRAERCVMATLDAVGHALACLANADASTPSPAEPPTRFDSIDQILEARTSALLGPMPIGRSARIMLTLPEECDSSAIDELLTEGADVVRINCAKGTAKSWQRIIEQVRRGEMRHGRECRVLCDLAGANPRTLDLDEEERRESIGRVSVGDHVRLCLKGSEPSRDRSRVLTVGCTLPSVIADLQPGERVFYDDGKFSGVVREVSGGGALIEVTMTRKDRVKVRAQKGLNFPDSKLNLPPLTPKDLEDLGFVARHADMVGLSFVREPQDVEALQTELARLAAPDLGVVLKIETAQAFQSLPHLLLTAMRSARVGVMVARGDMAMELGFERLAEAQEEVLWLSEAAFVPVIWATQVLDGLSKTGVPSRAEVTDAAMGGRAECVMLNQGEHQLAALRFLRDVLERMQQHHEKKRAMLRKLRISSVD